MSVLLLEDLDLSGSIQGSSLSEESLSNESDDLLYLSMSLLTLLRLMAGFGDSLLPTPSCELSERDLESRLGSLESEGDLLGLPNDSLEL